MSTFSKSLATTDISLEVKGKSRNVSAHEFFNMTCEYKRKKTDIQIIKLHQSTIIPKNKNKNQYYPKRDIASSKAKDKAQLKVLP